MFFVENGDLDEHAALPHKSFSFINDKNIIIKGQGRIKCFHLEEILLCRAVCKGPSTPSVAALALFYYLHVKKNSLLYYISSFATADERLSFLNIDIPLYSSVLLTCTHYSSECTVLGTARALGNFLADSIAVPGISFVTRHTEVTVQLINLQGLEPLLCTAL